MRFSLRVPVPVRVHSFFSLAAFVSLAVLWQARPARAQSLPEAPVPVEPASPSNTGAVPASAGDPSIPAAPSPYPTLAPTPRPSAAEQAHDSKASANSDVEADVLEDEIERTAAAQAIVEGFHFGPFVAFAFPHLQAGLDARIGGLGFSVNYGYTPRRIHSTKLMLTSFGATLRTFPFLGAFYSGFAFGHQNLRVEKRGTGTGKSVVEKRENLYMTPHVGLQFHLTPSFYFAQELGFVLFANGKRDGALARSFSPADTKTQDQVVQVAETYGENWLPYATFLKLGFQF